MVKSAEAYVVMRDGYEDANERIIAVCSLPLKDVRKWVEELAQREYPESASKGHWSMPTKGDPDDSPYFYYQNWETGIGGTVFGYCIEGPYPVV